MDNNINIAVIGSAGVGKSSFIQKVLGLQRPPAGNATTTRLNIDKIPHAVTLIELDLEYFDVDPNQQIQWPKQINGHAVPRVDGALILYDVMYKDSIIELPNVLSALSNSGLPSILVATKCDNPENTRQLDTAALAKACTSCVGSFKTSSNVPESARASLSAMLKEVVTRRRDPNDGNHSRRRAASAANLEAPPEVSGRPNSQQSYGHNRASSDLSLLRGFPSPPTVEFRGQPTRRSNAPPSPGGGHGPEITISASGQSLSSMLRTVGTRLDATADNSFLDIDESDAESYRYSDDIPILQRNEDFFDKPVKTTGVAFEELVDRLLGPRMTRADNNFADIFLCLYRKFAAPGDLFSTILTRLDRVKDDKNSHYLTKTATQLRIIEVVARWLSLYPGDFARQTTRRMLEDFVKHISAEPIFAAAAMQMRGHLEHTIHEDDDTGWEVSDQVTEEQSGETKKRSDVPDVGSLQLDGDSRPSNSSDMSHFARSSTGSQYQSHSLEDYGREAATMVPSGHLPMNKFRYHIFMDAEADDIADEITRIDWVMFSSIRIRDLVRHVSLPQSEKDKCRSLKNVNRMISHFNHVARWVSNMILIRDKAKHRAPCLEKFMTIALRLRQLNNYNGLAAVLAGINGTAIHRLAQTKALVGEQTDRKFQRCVLLMSTQKSHFAYRLAWENSTPPRIPFMPLHRRDLVSAEEGSRTFVGPQGDRINWKKFDVLGEVLLPLMKSQGTPYPNLTKNDLARELILECKLPEDDEETYQRSTTVEPVGQVDSSRSFLNWRNRRD